MVTIVFNDDKTLKITKSTSVYVGESGEQIILFMPQTYNNYNIAECNVKIVWLNSFNNGDVICGELLEEKRSTYLQYKIPIPTKMTTSVDTITIWVEVSNTTGILFKSVESSFPITSHLEISNYLDDVQLSEITQFELKMQQYNNEFDNKKTQINDTYNKSLELAKIILQMKNDVETIANKMGVAE